MIRRIIELALIAMVLLYIIHNPAHAANALRSVGDGIGTFVTSFVG